MKKYFSIGEAAKMANMTTETLRHYDRIGLVKPGRKDEHTGYRFYTEQEIIRLNTVQALRVMDLALSEIKRVLELNNLEEVVDFLRRAEQQADNKIDRLRKAKEKMRLARTDYEKKIPGRGETGNFVTRWFPERVILLSDTMAYPTLDNLWQYHSHFYKQLSADRQEAFAFEDLAGIYTCGGHSRLFAVCSQYPDKQGLVTLPAGLYLCADCTEDEKEKTTGELAAAAAEKYGLPASFILHIIVLTGILQWNYQAQVLVKPDAQDGHSAPA